MSWIELGHIPIAALVAIATERAEDRIVGMFFDGTPPTNLSLEQLAELKP
ncbi:MAG: hypothetical protein AAGB13_11395 [Cyanobacteria bacterium P01_F01_bin.33]